jgi:hypothetical protein
VKKIYLLLLALILIVATASFVWADGDSFFGGGGGIQSGDHIALGMGYPVFYDPTSDNSLCTAASTPIACCTGLGTGTCNKYVQFDASLLTANHTRIYSWPDKDGTIALLSDVGISTGLTDIASGSIALATSQISSHACQAVTPGTANSVAAANVIRSDVINWSPNASIAAVTGYAPPTALDIKPYPTTGYVNFNVCNNSGSAVTPGAVTLNYQVARRLCTAQTITWNTQPVTMSVGDSAQNLTQASSSSALGITYSTDTTDYCTVSGNVGSQVLNAVGAGTCLVHASQSGNSTYCAASSVDSGSITISAGAPGFTDNFHGTNGAAPNTNHWSAQQYNYENSGGDHGTGTWDIQNNTLYFNREAGGVNYFVYDWFNTANSLPLVDGRYIEITTASHTTNFTYAIIGMFNAANIASYQSGGYSASKFLTYVPNQVMLIIFNDGASTATVELTYGGSNGVNTIAGTPYTYTDTGTCVIRLTLINSTHASVSINGTVVIPSTVIAPTWGTDIYGFMSIDETSSGSAYQTFTITGAKFR